jgi:hypothetical protein
MAGANGRYEGSEDPLHRLIDIVAELVRGQEKIANSMVRLTECMDAGFTHLTTAQQMTEKRVAQLSEYQIQMASAQAGTERGISTLVSTLTEMVARMPPPDARPEE